MPRAKVENGRKTPKKVIRKPNGQQNGGTNSDSILSEEEIDEIPKSPVDSDCDSKKSLGGLDNESNYAPDFGGSMSKLLEKFSTDMNKTMQAKRRKLEQFTQESTRSTTKKVLETNKNQSNERKKLIEQYQNQLFAVIQQGESEVEKMKEAEDKLQKVLVQQQKQQQQIRIAHTQRLKVLKSLSEEFCKISPVDYFMDHANKKRLLFGGKRFAEQCFFSYRLVSPDLSQKSLSLPPCSLTFQYTELLHKLLRYGLFINSKSDDSDVGKLLTGIIGVFLNRPKEFIEHSGDFAREYVIKVKNMGEYLLRAVESVNPSIVMKFQGRRLAKRNLLFKVNEEFLPNLVNRFYRVQNLKHICRCRIRRILYDCWNLPIGIEVLPLPEMLKDYLNLKRD